MTQNILISQDQPAAGMLSFNDILGDGIGSMEVIQQCGDDKMIVNAARVSFGADNKLPLTQGDERLIKYLVEHHHTSPFEHNLLTVKVKLPLNIGEQWLRHRIGWSYNKESGRYIELSEPEFYIPVKFRMQSSNNRQASIDADADPFGTNALDMRLHCKKSVEIYKAMIEDGVAKEQARMVLPQALYMSMYATCNLNSLMHFVRLRDHEGAQWEMQCYSRALKEIAKHYWPVAMSALEN